MANSFYSMETGNRLIDFESNAQKHKCFKHDSEGSSLVMAFFMKAKEELSSLHVKKIVSIDLW